MPCLGVSAQGALDGGLNIPHNEKRMAGYDPITKEFDAEVLKSYIFGGHVSEYMEELKASRLLARLAGPAGGPTC